MKRGLQAAVLLAGSLVVWSRESPLIVAHRGATAKHPENTLAAFEAAFQLGADAIEGDFRMTSDGVIVCIHDEHTGRVSPAKVTVASSTYETLRRVGIQGKSTTQPYVIPTFAEVANTVPADRWFYIEVKGGVGMVPALLDQLAASKLKEPQVRIISFDPEVIRAVKTRKPDLKAYWLVSRKRGGFGGVSPSWERILQTLKDTGADGLSASKRHVSREQIQRVLDQGHSFHVWTVEDPKLARQFLEAGASSVTTKDPERLKVLNEPIAEETP